MDEAPDVTLRILAIDDEQTILNLYQKVLSPQGSNGDESRMESLASRLFGSEATRSVRTVYDLTLCRQGDEAVEAVRASLAEGRPYAVAFLDIRMPPGPDGVWTAEHIRELDPDLNIVIATAYSDFEPQDIARRVPPLDKLLYIQKPFHLHEILQFTSALAAKWEAEKQVKKAQSDLEERVSRRTAQLAKVNEQLQVEIGEHERIQRELESSISVLRATFESTAEGILVVDRAGKITNYNRRFLEMWRIPETGGICSDRTVLNHVLQQLKNPEGYLARGRALLEQPESESFDFLETLEGRCLERYSRPQWIAGRVVGRVWSFRDITRRKQAEEALRHSEEELRQAQKMEALGKLAGGVAHDFNNHLTAISGYSDLLLRSVAGEESLKRRVEEIRKSADRAATLTRQLLAFGRRQVLQTKMVEINAVVTDMKDMLRRLIGENIQLKTKLDPEMGTVRADPGQLEQVLMNLVVNARDAMPNGGVITIETGNGEGMIEGVGISGSGPCVLLSVSDTGMGMDEETKARIFEPFFTTKGEGAGTGLGLATVYGIVQQSGGQISVASKPGAGSTFRILLPRTSGFAEMASRQTSIGDLVGGTETLLLAEDEDGVRNLIIECLSSYGYTILAARDGNEALELSKEHKGEIHMVLTDLVMPHMNGGELAMNLSALRPSIKVLYMSGYTNDILVQSTRRVENSAFLAKPFSMEVLARTIRAILSGQEALMQNDSLSGPMRL